MNTDYKRLFGGIDSLQLTTATDAGTKKLHLSIMQLVGPHALLAHHAACDGGF